MTVERMIAEDYATVAQRLTEMATQMLRGKTALVTGGSRGIGRAAVLALATAGANVIVNYQRSVSAAEEVCATAQAFGVRAIAWAADVARDEETTAMVESVLREFGQVDILVNVAGITRDKSFVKMTKEMWTEVLDVNLNGLFNVTHALLPGMLETGWGRVINISSIVGQTGNFGQTNYAASKGGIIAFTMALAREVARKGVTVNTVSPGFIETEMLADMPPVAIDAIKTMTPIGRLGRPEEVAAAIAFLASPAAGYITGQVISVNGGMYM
jgi:3-oxoacyl-(acyl-carrier-protein) reductase